MSKTKGVLVASAVITVLTALAGIVLICTRDFLLGLALTVPLSITVTYLTFAIGRYGDKWSFLSGEFDEDKG
jgi:hypothetical protein